MKVLEFGCGTGSTALVHASEVAQITGIDYSPKMIAIAKSKSSAVENVRFETSTLEDWNSDEGPYDMILGLNVLHLLPDHRQAIEVAHRLLKPRGYLVTSTACLGEMGGVIKRILPIGSALCLLPYVAHFTQSELEADFSNAGFSVLQSWKPGPEQGVFHIHQKSDQA